MSKSETDAPTRKKRTEHGILPGDLSAEKLLERIVCDAVLRKIAMITSLLLVSVLHDTMIAALRQYDCC